MERHVGGTLPSLLVDSLIRYAFRRVEIFLPSSSPKQTSPACLPAAWLGHRRLAARQCSATLTECRLHPANENFRTDPPAASAPANQLWSCPSPSFPLLVQLLHPSFGFHRVCSASQAPWPSDFIPLVHRSAHSPGARLPLPTIPIHLRAFIVDASATLSRHPRPLGPPSFTTRDTQPSGGGRYHRQ